MPQSGDQQVQFQKLNLCLKRSEHLLFSCCNFIEKKVILQAVKPTFIFFYERSRFYRQKQAPLE